jgi:hypothetical protein
MRRPAKAASLKLVCLIQTDPLPKGGSGSLSIVAGIPAMIEDYGDHVDHFRGALSCVAGRNSNCRVWPSR